MKKIIKKKLDEMIEEEITIPGLSVDVEIIKLIFTALTKGIWAIHENGRIKFVYPWLIGFAFTKEKEPFFDITSPILRVHLSGGTALYPKDKGKTWALTKGELEK